MIIFAFLTGLPCLSISGALAHWLRAVTMVANVVYENIEPLAVSSRTNPKLADEILPREIALPLKVINVIDLEEQRLVFLKAIPKLECRGKSRIKVIVDDFRASKLNPAYFRVRSIG